MLGKLEFFEIFVNDRSYVISYADLQVYPGENPDWRFTADLQSSILLTTEVRSIKNPDAITNVFFLSERAAIAAAVFYIFFIFLKPALPPMTLRALITTTMTGIESRCHHLRCREPLSCFSALNKKETNSSLSHPETIVIVTASIAYISFHYEHCTAFLKWESKHSVRSFTWRQVNQEFYETVCISNSSEFLEMK